MTGLFDENIRQVHREYIREYREKHKEHLKIYRKNYYQENKKKLLEYLREKVECECGCVLCIGGLAVHRRTQKHKNLLLQKID